MTCGYGAIPSNHRSNIAFGSSPRTRRTYLGGRTRFSCHIIARLVAIRYGQIPTSQPQGPRIFPFPICPHGLLSSYNLATRHIFQRRSSQALFSQPYIFCLSLCNQRGPPLLKHKAVGGRIDINTSIFSNLRS